MNFFISSTVSGTHRFKMDRLVNGLQVVITCSAYYFVLFVFAWKNSFVKIGGEVAGIGFLKRISMELCGIECLDLTKHSVKMLGIHFSYNKKI